jgi:hypothetical protein
VTDERTRRVARNQAIYRQVNERVAELNEAFGEVSGDFLVVCECSDLLCTEQISLSVEAYERTRSSPTHFIVRPGHEAAAVEDVIAQEPGYLVVEKRAGKPATLAKATDPRT